MEEKSKMSKDIIARCTMGGRDFVITVDKKIYEKLSNGDYKDCTLEKSQEVEFIRKFTKPPKSLDIIGEER